MPMFLVWVVVGYRLQVYIGLFLYVFIFLCYGFIGYRFTVMGDIYL